MVVRELVARLGFQFDKKSIQRFDGAIGKAKRALRSLGQRARAFGQGLRSTMGRALSVVSVGGLSLFTKRLIEQGDQLAKQSKQLGISATSLRAWQHAAEISGLSAEQLNSSFTAFSAQIRGVLDGTAEAARNFERLGISAKRVREADDISALLLDVADGFSKLENPVEKLAAATSLFGRAGKAFIPFLDEGREGIEKLRAEVFAITGENGLDGFGKASEDAGDALTRFRLTTSILSQQLAAKVIPALTRFIQGASKLAKQYGPLIAKTSVLKAALVSLGALMLVIWGPALLAMLPVLAGFTAVFLVVEDFIGFIEGKDSVIGRLVESLGVSDEILASWEMLKDAVKAVAGTYLEILRMGKDFGIGLGDFLAQNFGDAPVPEDEREARRVYERAREASRMRRQPSQGSTINQSITVNNSGGDPEANAAATRRELERHTKQLERAFSESPSPLINTSPVVGP